MEITILLFIKGYIFFEKYGRKYFEKKDTLKQEVNIYAKSSNSPCCHIVVLLLYSR